MTIVSIPGAGGGTGGGATSGAGLLFQELGFNYYGPTGSQRDEMVAVRKLQGEVVY